jgi:GTPase
MMNDDVQRCGYVAIVGRPNVGKSTLLNHLLGRKLSITSRKPQTTRHNLLGVQTEGATQIVFVDTPGIHQPPARAMNRMMVRAATSVLKDVDLVLALFEARGLQPDDELVLEQLRQASPVRCMAVVNKIDQLKDQRLLLPLLEALAARGPFEEIVPVSALKDDGLELLKKLIVERLPPGPHLFPADQVTDRSERFLVGEIIREKLMRRLGDELPHRVTVVIEDFTEGKPAFDISAVIYVEREGHKPIIIGKDGQRLKAIGTDARRDIERLLEHKVMLRLWVKIREGWTDSEAALRQFGYD